MPRFLISAIAVALAGAPLAIAAAPSSTLPASAAASTTLATTQLPRNVRPTHYDIAVVPHAQTLTIDAQVMISIEVLEATDRITLNATDLVFSSVQLVPVTGEVKWAAPRVGFDTAAQTATFTFTQPITPGKYRLAISYTGKIGTQSSGLFALDYDTVAGKQRGLFTQFAVAEARTFVPSWDEPAYKATFALQAIVPSDQMAVSNMPAITTDDLGNGLTRVRFAPSPVMSTYLLFFSLGDFERATSQAGETEVGVVTRRGALPQAAFALETSRKVLHEFTDYFGVPYPLPKLDNIAAPGRGGFWAMENWGAILTFEHALLLDPAISTHTDKQNVFAITAHEIAHMWFGNLVTMRWWDDVWLNEGFASWLGSRTVVKLHPEWNTALSAVNDRESAMALDAVASTHPVVLRIDTVEQASQAFDAISYLKGEAVIRMLEGYVGADVWRDGVRRYIKAHTYGSTVSDDLWRHVEAAANKPITAVAHDFTLQPGVPMIRVGAASCADDTTTLQLTQDEFTKDRPGKAPLAWQVPVIAQVVGNPNPVRTLVSDGKATMTLPGCGPVLVNAGQSGYFRTLYPEAQFAALRDPFVNLSSLDQLGLMSDTWALGLAGLQPASDYLDLAVATPLGADPQIWGNIADRLNILDDYYRGDAARQATFRAFATKHLTPVLARVGWDTLDGESDPVAILRLQLISTLARLGDADVIAEARRRYAAQATDPTALPVPLRKTLLAVVARHADAATWEQLHTAALGEKTPLVKDELYRLLASTRDEVLAKRALELAITDEPGPANSTRMISVVAGQHPDLAFDFAIVHIAEVNSMLNAMRRTSYYAYLGSGSLDPAMVSKLRAYADAHLAAGSRRDTETAIANVIYSQSVRDLRLPVIDVWLAKQGG
ncbi:MAG: M1 family metallopeptidase [Pseudomarimonas sp.]